MKKGDWVYVSDESEKDAKERKRKRMYVSNNGGWFTCVMNGLSLEKTTNTVLWKYAVPCDEVSTEFREGDRVWDFVYGWGEVVAIIKSDLPYSIHVYYESGASETYDYSGCSISKRNRTLFFGEFSAPDDCLSIVRKKQMTVEELIVEAGYGINDIEIVKTKEL